MFADPEDRASAVIDGGMSYRRPSRSWSLVKKVLWGCAAVIAAMCIWAVIVFGAAAPNPAQERQNELMSRSTAHAYIVPAYQACMGKSEAKTDSSYMCIKKIALAAKTKSMTSFQIIGVFRDLEVDVNSRNFPPI